MGIEFYCSIFVVHVEESAVGVRIEVDIYFAFGEEDRGDFHQSESDHRCTLCIGACREPHLADGLVHGLYDYRRCVSQCPVKIENYNFCLCHGAKVCSYWVISSLAPLIYAILFCHDDHYFTFCTDFWRFHDARDGFSVLVPTSGVFLSRLDGFSLFAPTFGYFPVAAGWIFTSSADFWLFSYHARKDCAHGSLVERRLRRNGAHSPDFLGVIVRIHPHEKGF